MAAIAWPVFLHFWNDRQGRVLRIGSVALLERSSLRRSRSRRLSEWLLLLLRCMLLAVLALLLAGPSWKNTAATPELKGWLLIAPAEPIAAAPSSFTPLDPEAQRLYSPLIDSLSKAGYERQAFIDPSNPTPGAAVPSFWDAFRASDREAPANMPFVIISPAFASHFHGSRPVSIRPVKWYTFIPRDSTRHWIESAWLSAPDSIRVTEGFSAPGGTRFQYHSLPVRPGTIGAFHVGLTGGRLSVLLDDSSQGNIQSRGVVQTPVIVDTTTLRIAVYADPERRQDIRYITAAIRACGLFVKKPIQIDVATATGAPPATDWLFWLSSGPLPATTASHILQYEPGLPLPVDTWMQGVGGVKITKYVPDAATTGFTPVWQDGFGHPLLNEENTAGSSIFHFYSRFDPAWNDLVWSPRFPGLLADLLFSIDATTTGKARPALADSIDRRILDLEQVVPIKGHAKQDSNNKEASAIGLAPALGIFLLLLFIAERILSFRSSPSTNHERAVGTE